MTPNVKRRRRATGERIQHKEHHASFARGFQWHAYSTFVGNYQQPSAASFVDLGMAGWFHIQSCLYQITCEKLLTFY